MDKQPTVFISYCWKNSEQAEKIYTDLKQIGIKVIKDNHVLEYKDNLKSFMQSIRDADYALLLISEEYLQSVNCMYEASHLLKEQDVQNKILPVILEGTQIYKTEDRITAIRYWQNVIEDLQAKLDGLDPRLALDSYSDLKAITEISQLIDGFIKMITSVLLVKYDELLAENYLPLLKAIGYDDVTFLVDLLAISQVESVDQKDVLLDQYLAKYSANTYYHVIKANNLKRQKKFEQAKFNFLEAVRLRPENYEALNNLGYLYDMHYKDYINAKKCYEQAIRHYPEFTVARLNLGVLKSHHFDDREGAKRQYEKILEYEPECAKAHNNLGNYYKLPYRDKKNFKKASFHFLKAIELDPEYTEAYMNYGNLLKLNGLIEQGNQYYELGRIHDKNEHFKPVIEVMLKSVKG
jgi:tetratricopeptide (TPR) repeat protein